MIKKKKVLIFHPALAPYRVDIFNSINSNFNAFFFFFNRHNPNQKFDDFELKKLINFECNYIERGFKFLRHDFRFGYFKIFLKYKPDIIICSEYNLSNLYAIFYKLIFNNKLSIVSISDDNISIAKSTYPLKKIIRFFILKHIDFVILTHFQIIEWYYNNLSFNSKLLLLPILRYEPSFTKHLSNALPISEIYKNKFNIKNKKTFLYVGRLTRVKNLNSLLIAFHNIVKYNNDIVLFIVGSGEQESDLLNTINSFNLNNNVFLTGRYDGINLLAWYNIADVFILPSINELFGAVINEALISGCYILASEKAGATSLIKDNINGNTFNPTIQYDIENIICNTLKKKELFNIPFSLRKNRMLSNFDTYMDKIIFELDK
jgi:glycosyltransferase involved in cell wall biosynthesis